MTIHVTRLGELHGGPPARTMAPGRICQHADCDTRLSVYNPEPFCAVHQGDAEDEELTPAAVAPPAGFNRCPKCEVVRPWIPAYYHRDSKGGPHKLHRICKDCRNADRQPGRDPIAVRERRHCPGCGRDRPLTRRWWHRGESGTWPVLCRQCSPKEEPAS